MTPERCDPVSAVTSSIVDALATDTCVMGIDVDGVLAPIVTHADQATIPADVLDTVHALATTFPVAIVSGRSVDDLDRFGFADTLAVFGSHGGQRRHRDDHELDIGEQTRRDQVIAACSAAAAECGPGAWVENKPQGAVLHWRECTSADAQHVARRLIDDLSSRPDIWVTTGHHVVEAAVRHASKATAMRALASEVDAQRMIYLGDDRTDEDVFAVMSPSDIGIHVGAGDTLARMRLASPTEVAECLRAVVDHFGITTG